MFDHGGMHRDDPTTGSFQKSSTRLHTSGARGKCRGRGPLKLSVGRGLCGKANEGPELQQAFCMTLQSMHEITEFCSWSLR